MAEIPLRSELIAQQPDLHFAMGANGFMQTDGRWAFYPDLFNERREEFRGQQVSFFGPGGGGYPFFKVDGANSDQFRQILGQRNVIDAIAKYRRFGSPQARRIAFLLGGIVRQMSTGSRFNDGTSEMVSFAGEMTMMGEQKSGDAIASSISMYTISGGSVDRDRDFTGWVYHMADAIREDPLVPKETQDLGLSQIARLQGFVDRRDGAAPRKLPDVTDALREFEGFPTVGAEFHLPPAVTLDHKNLWKRLAILNMSQYQRGSYIQLSRNDRDVIEVRMNPSVYPVTIANWNYIRLLVPEIRHAFFTITLNRPGLESNFQSTNPLDSKLLQGIRALGMLSYATLFRNVPARGEPEEIGFGTSYLGQTVRIKDGEYDFSGQWSPRYPSHGQLGLYLGFGDNLPYLAYYTSMALANPDIFQSNELGLLQNIASLQQAIETSSHYRKYIFEAVNRLISKNPRLRQASDAGNQIVNALAP